ncbi:hypothetical protein [Streptomyces sp. NPDC056987]
MTGVPVLAADGATVTLGDTTLLAPTTFPVSGGVGRSHARWLGLSSP